MSTFVALSILVSFNFAGAARMDGRRLMSHHLENQNPWGKKDKKAPFKGYCSEVAQSQWRELRFALDQDKMNGHAYLHCVDGNRRHRYKISCRQKECTKSGQVKDDQLSVRQLGWCFVKNSCGGYFSGCKALTFAPGTAPDCTVSGGSSQDIKPDNGGNGPVNNGGNVVVDHDHGGGGQVDNGGIVVDNGQIEKPKPKPPAQEDEMIKKLGKDFYAIELNIVDSYGTNMEGVEVEVIDHNDFVHFKSAPTMAGMTKVYAKNGVWLVMSYDGGEDELQWEKGNCEPDEIKQGRCEWRHTIDTGF